MYSGYSGHIYSGHSDIVATFPGTKYIYSIVFKVTTISEVHCIVLLRGDQLIASSYKSNSCVSNDITELEFKENA